jgi:hypothetical protein
MPLAKPRNIYSFCPPSVELARRDINELLRLANAALGANAPPHAIAIDAALQLLADRRPGTWRYCVPAPVMATLATIVELTQNGPYYLRRCDQCRRWMFDDDARRATCNRRDCVNAVKSPQKAQQRARKAAIVQAEKDAKIRRARWERRQRMIV